MGNSHPSYVFWAAQEGRVNDLVYHLSCANKDVLTVRHTDNKWTPLHAAVARGHQQCVRVLWEAGSKLNSRDRNGYAPVHLAAINQHRYCLRLLLQLGASVATETKFAVTPLHLAASVGSSPLVEDIVQQGGYINAQESWGQTPLIIATSKNKLHAMATLLGLGADTEIKDYHHGYTALHVAVNTKDEETVLVLLDAGASLEATNQEGLTPLGLSLRNKFYRVVPLLLEYGAKLSTGDRCVLPRQLQDYIDRRAETPMTLQQLSRVNIRKSLGPSRMAELPKLGLEPDFLKYVQSILELCDGAEVKQASVQALTAEQNSTKKIEQFELYKSGP